MIASINGNKKNIPICLNNALLIVFSSVPIFLKMSYLSLLSLLSYNSFKANIAPLEIKNTIPKYKPINTTIAPNPILSSAICCLVSI